MLVSQILKTKGDQVFTIQSDRTVSSATDDLHRRGVGALVVLDEAGTLCGMFSERDVVRLLAEHGASALDLRVRDAMTRNVVTAQCEENACDLLERMTDRRVRHLPVLTTGRLTGLVSIGDLVKAKIMEAEAEAEGLKAYIAG